VDALAALNTTATGQPQPRDSRTAAWLLLPADGNAEPAPTPDGKVAEAQARIRTCRMLKGVAGTGDDWRVLPSGRDSEVVGLVALLADQKTAQSADELLRFVLLGSRSVTALNTARRGRAVAASSCWRGGRVSHGVRTPVTRAARAVAQPVAQSRTSLRDATVRSGV
jgi:hypothetical protein